VTTSTGAAPLTQGERTRRGIVLVVMCAGMFLILLDVTIVNVALPSIGTGLGAGVSDLQWVVDAYGVAIAALLIAGGAVGDRRGHRGVVVAGLAVFGCASLACGLAPGVAVLVAARVVQGVGAALLLPGTLAIITRAFPEPRERARAVGVWAASASLALPGGPLVGGALTSWLGWRAVFVVNAPVVAVAIAATLRWVARDRPAVAARVDVRGAVLAAVTLGSVVFAVITAGRTDGLSVVVLVAAGVAVVALAGFVVVERRVADPMLPFGLLRVRAFVGANLVAASMNTVGQGVPFVLTLYLQRVLHYSPVLAGLAALPMFAPLVLLSPVSGRLTARFGARVPMAAGLLLGAAGMATLLGLPPGAAYGDLVLALLGLGVGMGLLTAAVVTAAMSSVPSGKSGLASGVNNTARQAAGAIGVAVFGAVAGDPASAGFLGGLHRVALISMVLWTAAAALTVWTVRTARDRP
jgi:DHA2 family methylenomycin A resistance protein-like MFS transporter